MNMNSISPCQRVLKRLACPLLVASVLLAAASTGRAQWVTETVDLKSGWNAVYLHVDGSHADIGALAGTGSPVQEVWLWQPAPTTVQFVQNPQEPVDTGTQWKSWKRSEVVNGLNRLVGNASYLVRASADYQWSIKGRPVPPRQQWTTTGLNLLGYPTVPSSPPSFDQFFAQSPAIRQELQVFYYNGGALGTTNPRELFNFMLAGKSVRRGEAYWLRAGNMYNTAYGPFEVALSATDGLNFGDSLSQISFRLRNLHPNTNTVTLRLLDSETPPAGQTAIQGTPPLLVRGALNLSNLTYGYTGVSANGAVDFVLGPVGQPGSEVEVVVGINRYALANAPGSLLAGIVRLTDSLGYTQIDLPLSVTVSSAAGLWVGNASVSSVNSYLNTYQKNTDGTLATRPVETGGGYIVTGTDTSAAPVTRAFPLRLIVHSDATGNNAVLLARVYHGLDANTNTIVTPRESNLNKSLIRSARRITAPHLPWTSANVPWPFSGQFRQGGSVTNTVTLNHADQASNPFLHTYHPDHDNLNATFQALQPQGYESYTVTRKIVLSFQSPENDFASLTASGQRLDGDYTEEITIAGRGSESRTFMVSGSFTLNRISNIATLTP